MDTTSPVPDDREPAHEPGGDPDELLAELAGSDPADAPEAADRLASELQRRLESEA